MKDIEKIYNTLIARGFYKQLFADIIPEKSTQGSEILVCCPLHNDKTPSFSISTEKPLFNCFGCGKKGDWIKYLECKNGWDFTTASNWLIEQAGLKESDIKINTAEYKAPGKKPRELRDIPEEEIFANYIYWLDCHNNLLENKKAQEFIKNKRGIDLQTIKDVGIGIDTKKSMWVFPILSAEKTFINPINETGFTLGGFELRKNDFSKFNTGSKCIKTNGALNTLCSINQYKENMNSVIILEGFIDAYLYVQYLREKNIKNIWVLSPSCGLSKLTEQISGYDFSGFKKVTIMLDNDFDNINSKGELENIGFNKMEELNELFPGFHYNCLPEGIKDFNEWYLKNESVKNEI